MVCFYFGRDSVRHIVFLPSLDCTGPLAEGTNIVCIFSPLHPIGDLWWLAAERTVVNSPMCLFDSSTVMNCLSLFCLVFYSPPVYQMSLDFSLTSQILPLPSSITSFPSPEPPCQYFQLIH